MARADLIKQVEEEIARREEEKRKSLQIQDATQKTGTAQVPEANILAQKLARQSKQQGGNRASTLMTQLQMSGGLTGREQTRVAAHLAAQQWKQKTKAQQAETYAEVIKGMKEAAQKEYDDYIATPEYQLYKQNTPQSQPLNVGAPSPTNPYYGMTSPNQEATYRDQAAPGQPQYRERKEESPEGKREAELKQKVDYWQRMENAYRDQAIYFADMEAINAMPEEDRQALHNYVEVMRKGGVVPAMIQSGDGMNLAQKYGAENFRNYAETYERYLSAQEAEKVREFAKLGINGDNIIGPEILHSAGSVAANLVGAVTSPVEAIKGLVSGTGRYSTMDPNGLGNLAHIYAEAVRENVGGEIRNAGGDVAGEIGAALYNAGMSALDSLTRVAVTGGTGSLALSATGSFGQTVQEASRAGASPLEAVGLGVVTGGLEVITEKVSLDRLLGDIGGNPKNAAQIVKSALIQGGVEVSEEELALLGSTLAEAAILRGNSGYNQNVQRLMMEEGLSYEEAVRKADEALVMEAWQTMYTSFLSGGMMSGATQGVDYAMNHADAEAQSREDAARKFEEQFDQRFPTTAEPEQEAQEPEVSTTDDLADRMIPVRAAMNEYRSQGKVTNRMATIILGDSQAMAQLGQETGLSLPGTASGNRSAVKEAIAQMVHKQDLESQSKPRDIYLEAAKDLMGVENRESAPVATAPTETAGRVMEHGKDRTIRPKPNAPEGAPEGFEAMGAASAGFDNVDYSLMGEGNEQRDRPGDVRPVSLNIPKTDKDGKQISESVGNIFGSKLTSDAFADTVQRMAFDGAFSFDTTTNEETLQKAAQRIAERGTLAVSIGKIEEIAEKGKASPEDISEAMLLYGYLANRPDGESQKYAAKICVALQKFATTSAKGLQLYSLFRKMTPDGQMMAIMQTVKTSISDMIRKGLIKKDTNVQIEQELLNEYRKAAEEVKRLEAAEERLEDAQERIGRAKEETKEAEREARKAERKADRAEEKANAAEDEAAEALAADQERIEAAEERLEDAKKRVKDARKEVRKADRLEKAVKRLEDTEKAIYAAAAAKIETTFKNKWDTWRYMAMLGNAKTQIRNIGGNLAYMPHTELKRTIGAILEKFIEKDKRTKALVGFTGKDLELRKWASQDANTASVHKALEYSAKLGDSTAAREIRERVRVFDSEWLEKTRKAVEGVPSWTDMLFKNAEYINSMAGFMKARGYTAQQIQSGLVPKGVLNEGRVYAINEAMKATFNDSNKFSDALSNLRYNGNNVYLKALNIVGEGVLPFRRTPANIVVRFAEGTIFNSFRGVANLCTKVRRGEMSAATAIDQIAAGMTGSMMVALGYFLASGALGFVRLRGSNVDEDEERQGHQKYALEIKFGGKWYSYKIDWLAPSNLPLFVGANICDTLHGRGVDGDMSLLTSIVYGTLNSFEPLLALSCLSGLNDIFQTARSAGEDTALWEVAADVVTGYFTQGIPALIRQGVEATQKNRRETFANSEDPLLRDLQSGAAQVAGFGEFFKTDKIDQWGEVESKGGTFWQVFNAFFNPGTGKAIDDSELEQEITRLNSVQPESVSPPDTPNKLTYTDTDGNRHEDYRLTEKEYNALRKVQGQTAKAILTEIVKSEDYKALTDEQKAQVFSNVYDYAREAGRQAAIPGYDGMSSWMQGIDGNAPAVIVQRVVQSDISGAFDNLTTAWREGYSDDGKTLEALESAAKVYDSLSPEMQKSVAEASSGRVAAFLEARAAGVDSQTFRELYRRYWDIDQREGMTATRRANAWAAELREAMEEHRITQQQHDILRDALVFRSSQEAEATRFDGFIESGIDTDDAAKLAELMYSIQGTGSYDPETGRNTVRDVDRMQAVAGASYLTPDERFDAMRAFMTESQEEKMEAIRDEFDVSASQYAAIYRAYLPQDTKAEEIAAYMKLGYTEQEAERIYRIYHPTK